MRTWAAASLRRDAQMHGSRDAPVPFTFKKSHVINLYLDAFNAW